MFHQNAKKLYEKIKEYGNPFEIDHANLLKLDTQEAFDPSVAEAISSLEKTGLDQSDNFRKDVLENGTKEVHDTIKRNALPLLSTPLRHVLTAAGKKLRS